MTERITNPWQDGEILYAADLNDSFEYAINYFIRDVAEMQLRLDVLEVNAGVSGSDDDLSDIFINSSGLKNTIDDKNSTSYYDTSIETYRNDASFEPDATTTTTDLPYTTSAASGYTSYMPFSINNISKLCKINALYGIPFKDRTNVSGTKYYTIKIIRDSDNFTIFQYDGSIYLNANQATGLYLTFDINSYLDFLKPNETYTLIFSTTNGYFPTSGAETSTSSSLMTISTKGYGVFSTDIIGNSTVYSTSNTFSVNFTNPQEKYIHINYIKPKPNSIYLYLFDENGDITNVGDVEYQFTDGTNYSEWFLPYQIYDNINLSFTPTKLIIKQKDTAVSKISKYVLLISY